jgi:tetratricopeptide (TPR) repeat protein
MIKPVFAAVVGGMLLLAACSGEKSGPSKEELIEDVSHFEDSLKKLPANNAGGSALSVAYADKCLLVYRNFPQSEEAPEYLDKAHVILSGAGLHRVAVQYADTLIQKYPNYKNRPMVLQSLASAYDIFIVPRRKDMVKRYYKQLLKENPDLPKEEKQMVQNRLDHIDLTFEEMITQPQKK